MPFARLVDVSPGGDLLQALLQSAQPSLFFRIFADLFSMENRAIDGFCGGCKRRFAAVFFPHGEPREQQEQTGKDVHFF